VGTYAITPSAVSFGSAGSAAKYSTISYQNALVTIIKATLQLTPSAVTVIYGSAVPTLSFTASGFKYSEALGSISGYVAPVCSTSYGQSTPVSASPVSVSCSGGSAANYTFATGTSDAISITRRPLTVSGTTIAPRPFNGTTAPGSITIGTVNGYASGESLPISASATDYSSLATGIYNSTVSYSISNNADSSKGIANNYTISASTVSGQITQAQTGFAVALSQAGVTASNGITWGNADTLTVTATTSNSGSVNFKVSVNGGSASDIPGCSDVTISGGAAVCAWANPSIGKIQITATMTPNDFEPKVIDAIVVAKPYITSFQVKGSSGVTQGPAGTVVVITGANFTGISDIKFNGVSAEKTFRATATQATVTVPFGATTGLITIETLLGGATTSTASFTVTR